MIKKEVSNSRHDSCQISAAAGIKGSRPITGLSLALPSTQSAVGSFIFTLKKIYSRVIFPSLTLCRVKNSHNPSIYGKCGCFHFCINMYYF